MFLLNFKVKRLQLPKKKKEKKLVFMSFKVISNFQK